MVTRVPCATDEWYHTFNRGVDKRDVFLDTSDYERFLMLLYTGNATNPIKLFELKKPSLVQIIRNTQRGPPIVEIAAYALMPNHVHIVLKQLQDGSIAKLMQKIYTGYTMYFNTKYSRTGSLFSGTYKAKHISNDEYLKNALSYVMLNPVELFEPRWKEGAGNIAKVQQQLLTYRYASCQDFFGAVRPENALISSLLKEEYYDARPQLKELLSDALEYYRDHASSLDP